MIKPYYSEPNITIYNGDCLEVMKELPAVNLVLIDPPYNVKKDYGECKDNLNKKEYLGLIETLIKNYKRITDNKIIIILGSKMVRDWWNYIPDAKLIIVKMGAVSNNRIKNLSLQFHCILTTVKSNKSGPDIWTDIRWPGEGYFFNEPRYGHPAMTPLKLTKRLISLFSNEGDTILDSFLGSGTTVRACKDLGRKCIGIEISKKYCDIAVRRLGQEVFNFND